MVAQRITKALIAVSAVALAACADEPEPQVMAQPEVAEPAGWQVIGTEQAFRDEIVGRTLYLDDGEAVFLAADGTFRGTGKGGAPAGRWIYRDGQFCAETVAGASALPSGCYRVEFDGRRARLAGAGGRMIGAEIG